MLIPAPQRFRASGRVRVAGGYLTTVLNRTRATPQINLAPYPNVKAYLAAYREAVQILNTNDDIWMEVGRRQKMDEAVIPPLRDEMRRDLMSKFEPTTEVAVRNIFDVLLATAGPTVLGMSKLPDVFMTKEYQ